MNKLKKNNIVKFPDFKVTDQEKEIEAILFASNTPLDVDAIESKITKKTNVEKVLENLKNYKNFFLRNNLVQTMVIDSKCRHLKKLK